MSVFHLLPPSLSGLFISQMEQREKAAQMATFCLQNSHDFTSFLGALLEAIDYLETEKINPILKQYFDQGIASLESKEINYDVFCCGMLELFSQRIKATDLNWIFVAIEQYLSLRVAPYVDYLVRIIEDQKGRMQIDEEVNSAQSDDIRNLQIMLLRLIPYVEKRKREIAFSNCKEALEGFLPPSFSSVSCCPFSLIGLEGEIHQSIGRLERIRGLKQEIEIHKSNTINLEREVDEDHPTLIKANEQEGMLYQELRLLSRAQSLSALLNSNKHRMIDSEQASYENVEEVLKFARFLMTVQSTIIVMQKSHLSSSIEVLESNFKMLSEGLPAILGSPCSFELGGYLRTEFLKEVKIISSEATELGVDCSFVQFDDLIAIEGISQELFVKILTLNQNIEHLISQGNTAEQTRETLASLHHQTVQIIYERESNQEEAIPLLLEIEQYLTAQSQLPVIDQEAYVQTLYQINHFLSQFLEHVRPKDLSMEDVLKRVQKIKISLF